MNKTKELDTLLLSSDYIKALLDVGIRFKDTYAMLSLNGDVNGKTTYMLAWDSLIRIPASYTGAPTLEELEDYIPLSLYFNDTEYIFVYTLNNGLPFMGYEDSEEGELLEVGDETICIEADLNKKELYSEILLKLVNSVVTADYINNKAWKGATNE